MHAWKNWEYTFFNPFKFSIRKYWFKQVNALHWKSSRVRVVRFFGESCRRSKEKKLWGRHHRFFLQRISRTADTRLLSIFFSLGFFRCVCRWGWKRAVRRFAISSVEQSATNKGYRAEYIVEKQHQRDRTCTCIGNEINSQANSKDHNFFKSINFVERNQKPDVWSVRMNTVSNVYFVSTGWRFIIGEIANSHPVLISIRMEILHSQKGWINLILKWKNVRWHQRRKKN